MTTLYDGTTNPKEFVQLYTMAMVASGANDKILANWFPMVLKSNVRPWLMNQPEGSIGSWKELGDLFTAAF